MYLLDTNICIALLEGDSRAQQRLLESSPEDVVLCSVVKAELLFGARNGTRVEANLRRLDRFFEPFRSLSFDDAAAAQYGLIRAQLRRQGRPIGANDMLIASIALSNDATLVTRDTEEFARVAGLRLATW